ncbi:response regulator transcription factor [Streptomyces sp. NPDC005708]|uniref:response regulator transcription factor n=1 Tax=Streptomyces sp. NPDC005708 TaxID=3154564 RepID=UPI0033F17315
MDPHPIMRQALAQVLDMDPGMRIVALAETLDVLLAEIDGGGDSRSDHWPDVILAELYQGNAASDYRALDLIAWLAERGPVLATTGSARPVDAVAAIQAGASGYLYKGQSVDTIIHAVERVAVGGMFISPQVNNESLETPQPGALRGGRMWLSRREQEVIEHLTAGLTPAQTAQRMGVSRSTIDTFLARIRAKASRSRSGQDTR